MRVNGVLCGCFLLATLCGCDRAVVSGRVLSIDGESLPGVVVSVEDASGLEALTNSLGEYRLVPPVGPHGLRYSKSGYAPAAASVEVSPRASIRLDDVVMWRLPRGKGVYLYEDKQFISTTSAEPKTYLLDDDMVDFAIRGVIQARTANTEPLILCYHVPRYEARLTRLRTASARLKEGQEYTFDVLARAGSIPVRLMAVDQPEGLLMKVAFDEPLEPGGYALHWGALVGESVLEARAYLFEIVAPGDVTADEVVIVDPDPPAGADTDSPVEEAPAAEEIPDAEAADETEETEN